MGIIKLGSRFLLRKEKEPRKELLNFLKELEQLESKLWGVEIRNLENGEEEALEDTNHLIHLINKGDYSELISIFNLNTTVELLQSLQNIREDFLRLRRKIRDQQTLQNLISNFSIKLVDHKNFAKLENIFILEKQLYTVLDKQEEEFSEIFRQARLLKITSKESIDDFLDNLKSIRNVLAGHLDHHSLWEEEKLGFSNTSNILNSLIREVKEEI